MNKTNEKKNKKVSNGLILFRKKTQKIKRKKVLYKKQKKKSKGSPI